jgi:hypothetical protein
MAVDKLASKTEIVATKVLDSTQETPAFHRIAEIHFPSMDELQACAASEGGKKDNRSRLTHLIGRCTKVSRS